MMVLYGIVGALVISLMICLKGPLELLILKTAGFPLAEAFEATIKKGGAEALIKGGTLTLVLVAQPIVMGFFFLKILDRIFQVTAVRAAGVSGRLVDDKGGDGPKTEQDIKEILRMTPTWSPPIRHASGPTATAEYDIDNKIREDAPGEFLIKAILFRGSRLHFCVMLGTFALFMYGCFIQPTALVPLTTYPFILSVFGPTYFCYLALFAIYRDTSTINYRALRREFTRTDLNLREAQRRRVTASGARQDLTDLRRAFVRYVIFPEEACAHAFTLNQSIASEYRASTSILEREFARQITNNPWMLSEEALRAAYRSSDKQVKLIRRIYDHAIVGILKPALLDGIILGPFPYGKVAEIILTDKRLLPVFFERNWRLRMFIRIVSLISCIQITAKIVRSKAIDNLRIVMWKGIGWIDFLCNVGLHREVRSRYFHRIHQQKQIERNSNMSWFARQLLALGEERAGRYAFIANPFAYQIAERWSIIYKLSRIFPIF